MPSGGLGDNSQLKKRKPTETSLQTLIKTKNVGQLSFADEAEEELAVLPRKEKKPEEAKKSPAQPDAAPKQPKPKVNLLEEDEETKRQKQEALEVGSVYPAPC